MAFYLKFTHNMSSLQEEISRRRTFAIISHPDAGKTTLTEKLLWFGGAIQVAGEVRGRKASRHATSDWMELEKQRGISVTSSVMQFPVSYTHLDVYKRQQQELRWCASPHVNLQNHLNHDKSCAP